MSADDDTTFLAYFAYPSEGASRGVVILPDFRGLGEFYKGMARRLAETGISAIAIDYFGRSAGIGERNPDEFDAMGHVKLLTPEHVASDVRAAADRLYTEDEGRITSVFTVGFCFGGSQSWNQSALNDGLAGAIGFYGRPSDCRPFVSSMRAPLLLLVAGADALTPVEDFERFDRELSEAGVEHRQVVYQNAPHAFFDRAYEAHAEACADAWRELLEFTDRYARP